MRREPREPDSKGILGDMVSWDPILMGDSWEPMEKVGREKGSN